MTGAFQGFQGQVAATNAQLAQMVSLQNQIDPAGYERMMRAAQRSDQVWRNAVGSTGMFHQQQVRVNSATDDYLQKLQKQKMSFRELYRERKTASAAYRQQLAMENMLVRQSAAGSSRGRQLLDVAYTREVSGELHKAGNRMAWFNEQLRSGAHQMVNWGKNTQWAGRQLTVGFTMPLLAAGAAAGVLAYQIDKEMTRIVKVYDTTADATSDKVEDMVAVEKELAAVREASTATALKAAKEYGIAATDTLNVQAELAATGIRGIELQKSTNEVMRIARLGELDYQTATQATIALQTVFRMSTDELTESFNYMNSIENATSLTTQDFATAIPIAAGTIREFGGDVKELGILLTAMKSRGIEASQAANGLKATMQRLGRPSKQIQEEFKAITGANLKNLVDTSDSLTEIFQKLREETKDLTAPERRDVFAGVFGSYQVKQMMALVDGMEDLEQGYGQVSRAQEIANGSTKSWADTAEREMTRYQESISGQFDRAWQSVKAQAATLGGPFLKAATVILRVVSNLIEKFNSFPDLAKHIIAWPVLITALAGPMIMLTGLFANLGGHGLKLIAAITGVGNRMKIMTTEQKAAALAAELVSTQLVDEKTALDIVSASLKKYELSEQAATAAVRGHAAALAASQPRPTNGWGVAQSSTSAATTATQTAVIANNMERTQRTSLLTKVSMAAMAGSMLSMVLPSGEIGNNIGTWLLVISSLLPLLDMAVVKMVRMKNAAKATAAANAASAAAGTVGAAGAAGKTGMFSRAVGFLTKPTSLIGAAGAVVIGGALWQANREMEKREEIIKALEESRRRQAEVLTVTSDWADATGNAWKNYKRYNAEGLVDLNRKKQSAYDKSYEFYSTPEKEGGGKEKADAFTSLSDTEREFKMLLMMSELIERAGLTAKETKVEMAAFLRAAGMDVYEAGDLIDKTLSNLGKKGVVNWGKTMREGLKQAFTSTNPQFAEEAGKAAGSAFQEGFRQADNKADYVEEWHQKFLSKWESKRRELARFFKKRGGVSQFFTETSDLVGEDLEAEIERWKGIATDVEKFRTAAFEGELGSTNGFEWESGEMIKLERAFFGAAAEARGMASDVDTMNDFLRQTQILAITMDKQQKGEYLEGLNDAVTDIHIRMMRIREMPDLFGEQDAQLKVLEKQEDDLKRIMAVLLASENIKPGDSAAQMWGNWVHGVEEVEEKLGDVDEKADDVAKEKREITFKVKAEDMANIQREAMQSIQQEMADDAMSAFDARMESAIDARQRMWDARQAAMENEHERQQRALETKWEKRKSEAEKYWDRREENINRLVEAEERAEEKRQRMFDAEMERISRLNEAMNQNIDFNVALNEGNLDEAARIRNDVNARSAQNALERAASAGGRRSENRIETYEDRLERIEKERDAHMDRLEKQEEAEKRHLDRVHEMREKALDRQVESDMAALEQMWENEKESLQDQLDLFTSYIARNKKDLEKHMRTVGLSYKDFGDNKLKPMGKNWAEYFGERLRYYIRQAGLSLRTDKMWEKMGKSASKEIVKGMGFDSMAEFKHFIRTGDMGGGGKPSPDPMEDRHQGGFVGEGRGSRYGVARTQRGLAPSETIIRAQHGEFVVNRDAAKNNAALLHAMNRGGRVSDIAKVSQDDGKHMNGKMEGLGAGPGLAGLLSAFTARGLISGTAKAMKTAYNKTKQTTSGIFGTAGPGMYGNTQFSADQMRNAAIIAKVGSGMGMSTRDIVIGLMTAMQESMLRNVDYGDRDSLGLFQQRPSQGWGTPAQVTDPYYASKKFFSVLKTVEDRNTMPMWAAAQAVQRSAYPTAYAKWSDEARAMVQAMMQTGGGMGEMGFDSGPANRLGRAAIQWAADRIGDGGWQALCQKFVRMAFGAPGGFASAISAWHGARSQHAGDWTPPPGVPVYWSGGTFGHAALHTGGGNIISTDYPRMGYIGTGTLQGLTRDWGKHYLGWTGDINGKQVYPIPGMKTGGTVRHNNTLANLHKDERVLTAPLTSKLDVVVDSLFRSAKDKNKKKRKKNKYDYPGLGTGAADYPYTWFDTEMLKSRGGKKNNNGPKPPPDRNDSPLGSVDDTGKGFRVTIGNFNTGPHSSPAQNVSDIRRLMGSTDILTLTEMKSGYRQISQLLNNSNWGLVSGGRGAYAKDVGLAYRKSKFDLKKSGVKKLGDKTANILGGRAKRFAPYGLLKDRKSGRHMWQVAAHTVPTPGFDKRHRELFFEQWGNLDQLVEDLRATGAPVFVGGDLNITRKRPWWRTPGDLKGIFGGGVDWMYHQKNKANLMNRRFVGGLHSDHPGAHIGSYNVPSLAVGGRIKWDNTLANLHKDERVLTAPLSKQFERGVDNFANGVGDQYNVEMTVYEAQDGKKLFREFEAEMERKTGRRPKRRRENP